jgi:hypothetical protein
MIFYLNKGLILEQEIVKAIQRYFNTLDIADFYKKVTISVTNKHPFGKLFLNKINGEKPQASLFPCVVVASLDDDKPAELADLVEVGGIEILPEDVNPPPDQPGAKSPLEEYGYLMLTPQKIKAIQNVVNSAGRVYGVSSRIHRRDRISIEIWSENIQLKNELYEAVRLFVCGFMKEAFEKLYEESGFTLFDNSVHGERSNNFNSEFGIEIWGSNIIFEVDYTIEQTVIDTDLVDGEIDFMEVVNHVKGQAGIRRSVIIGRGDGAEPDGGGADE